MRQSTVLVVDDEKEIADFIELYLKNENYNVHKWKGCLGVCRT